MNLNTGAGNKLVRKFPIKKIIIVLIAIALIATAATIGVKYFRQGSSKASTEQQSTAIVTKGDLSVAVSGSAPISSTTKYDFTSNVSGTLTKIYFKNGDKVKAGDLMFEIDDKDTRLNISQLENNIAQALLSRESNVKDLKSGTITAPIDGEVLDVQVKEGDSISNGGTLLTITDKSKLKLVASFSNAYRNKLAVGQEVSVNAFNTTTEELHKAKGRISSISTPSYKTSDGSEVYNVGVTIDNSSNLEEGMVANVEINAGGNTLKSKDSSTLSYIKSMTVKSNSGGTVSKLNVENGQYIKKGDVLAELGNDDLELSIKTSDLKLEDYYSQLEIAQEKLLDYKIYAPFDGTFTLNDVEQGNSIKQGDILGSIANYDAMEFSIDVDELDISKIEVGQTANVTIDALTETTDNPLKGTVTEIAVEGTSADGVSTYPVTIQLEPNTSLKGGMNANAEIVVSEKTGVLYVPVDAVNKRNGKSFVTVVKETGTDNAGQNNGNQNQQETGLATERKEVTTGISTEDYIEILSGVNEGDKVIVTSTSSTNKNQMMPGGGMGMPMGGPPSGGSGNNTRKN